MPRALWFNIRVLCLRRLKLLPPRRAPCCRSGSTASASSRKVPRSRPGSSVHVRTQEFRERVRRAKSLAARQDAAGAKPPKPCELAEELLEGCGAAVELLESRLCRRYALEHVCFLLCQILPIADARMGTRARIRGSRGLEA